MSKGLKSMKQQEEEKEQQERARELKRIEKDIERELIKQQLFYEIFETLEETGGAFNIYNLDFKSETIEKIVKTHAWLFPDSFYIYFLHKNYDRIARQSLKYYNENNKKDFFTPEEYKAMNEKQKQFFEGLHLKRKKAGILSHFLIALFFK